MGGTEVPPYEFGAGRSANVGRNFSSALWFRLVRHRRLLRQAHQLYGYLHRTDTTAITARVAHLEAQIAVTQDGYSRQQLVEAAAALRRQIENCEQIRLLISRIEATLDRCVIHEHWTAVNQNGELVMTAKGINMVRRRPA